jgi:hypothetical protein
MTGIRSPAEAIRIFSSLSEAHSASYPMGTVFLPEVKRGRSVTLTTHPHLVPRSRMSRSSMSCPPWRLHDVADSFYFCFSCRPFDRWSRSKHVSEPGVVSLVSNTKADRLPINYSLLLAPFKNYRCKCSQNVDLKYRDFPFVHPV